ncbi:hypothetical protein D3C72_1081910 [compost metagenome]
MNAFNLRHSFSFNTNADHAIQDFFLFEVISLSNRLNEFFSVHDIPYELIASM